MQLPSIRSIRESDVKIGSKTLRIQPWSNRDVIRYETALKDNPTLEERKQCIFDYLIKPNIGDAADSLNLFEREVVYIEMYKLSKGVLIPLQYKCPDKDCGQITELNFNLLTNYKLHDMTTKEIKTDDVKFTLKYSSYFPKPGDDSIRFYASFIKEFEYKNQKFISDLDELENWLLDELDEVNFAQFLEQMIIALPKIELSMECTCSLCGNIDTFHFNELPDFS